MPSAKENPFQLKSLAKKYIIKPRYPKDVVATAAANIEFIKSIDEWEGKLTVQEENIKYTGEIYQTYSFPECSQERD